MSETSSAIIPFPEKPSPIHAAAEIRTAASVLIERMQFFRQAGLSFGGKRDLYEVLGYNERISPAEYRARYTRGGLAGRVVDAIINASWRGGVELVEDDDPDKHTPFEEEAACLIERLDLWSIIHRTDLLAAQGRYAVLLIGAPGEDLAEEMPKGGGKSDSILYLQPFPEEDARIAEWETSARSARFGQPKSYQLSRLNSGSTIGNAVPGFSSTDLVKPVHWTRLIHLPSDGLLDNEVFGPPALERVWNLFDDLDKVTGGGAEAFWLRANQGVQLDIDKDMKVSDAERDDLKKQAEEYAHQIRRILRTRGVKANTLGSDVANFSNPADAIITQIAGAKGIPKRTLTGSEMGELASSQDRDNWKDQVNGRQTSYCGPRAIKPLFTRLIDYNYLPKPKTFKVSWPHIEVMTETEKAAGAQTWAGTATGEGPVFTRDEIRDKWYAMKPLPKPEVVEQPAAEGGNLEHTSPEGGKPVTPKLDEETLLPLKQEQIDPMTGKPIVKEIPGKGSPFGKKPPFGKKLPFQKRAAEDIGTVLAALETAIETGDIDTLDVILGVKHEPEIGLVMALEGALLADNAAAVQQIIDQAMREPRGI